MPEEESIQRRCAIPASKRKSGNIATMCPRTGQRRGSGTGRRVRRETTDIRRSAVEAPTKKWVNQWNRASWAK